MKKNLVITAAFGFGIDQLELFIRSLRAHYKGDVCFVIGKNDKKLEIELKKNDCIVIKKKIDKRDIQLKRYNIFLDFLISNKYEKILFCDSRDVYFQANPFKYSYKGSINFFLEDIKIKNCIFNKNWMIGTYGLETYIKLSNKIISCGGTIIGSYYGMKKFLELMILETSKHKYKKRLKYFLTFRRDPQSRGSDQSHGNFIAHNRLIKKTFFYSNAEGPVATIYHLKKIIFNNNNELVNSLNKPYLIVHQYDKRWQEMRNSVRILKSKLGIKNLI